MKPFLDVFSYQPCENVAPFQPLPVPREIGFYDGDGFCPGYFLGYILFRNGRWYFYQRAVGDEARLTADNLKTIARRLDEEARKTRQEDWKKGKTETP